MSLPPVAVRGARVRDPAWESYAQSFRAMEMYLRSAGSDEPLEPRLYLRALRADAPPSSELRLTLSGTAYDREIPLTHYWGSLPHDPAAKAANADFTLDAPAASFALVRTLGIRRLQSGDYPGTYLQHACDRWLAVMRDMHLAYKLRYAFKHCVGVKFIVPAGSALPAVSPGSSIEREAPRGVNNRELEVLLYRFTNAAEASVQVPGELIAITPWLE